MFRRAASDGDTPEERLHAMGKAYVEELLPDRHAILMQMQGYVASSDSEIQAHVRAALGRIVSEITLLSGASGKRLALLRDGDAPQHHRRRSTSTAIAGGERVGGRRGRRPARMTRDGDDPDC